MYKLLSFDPGGSIPLSNPFFYGKLYSAGYFLKVIFPFFTIFLNVFYKILVNALILLGF
jgi:hypothetical protein